MRFNFATSLSDAARARPSKPFLIDVDGSEYTFAQIERRAARAARVLADLGVGAGDRVGIRLPNTVDFVPYYYALLALGAVALPLNPAASAREVDYIARDASLLAVIVLGADAVHSEWSVPLWSIARLVANEAERPDQPFAPVDVEAEETALVLYTSGSTGASKGVELSHLNLLLVPLLGGATVGVHEDDVIYAVLPFFHVFGLYELVHGGTVRRQTLIVREKFSRADLLDAIERYRVTSVSGVPTMFHAITSMDTSDRDLTSVRMIGSGGAPISLEQIDRIRRTFPNAEYSEGYGLTETGSLGTYNGPPFEFRHGSVGRAIQGVQVAIVDEDDRELPPGPDSVGEIVIGGPVLMKRYLGRPEETATALRNGRLHTGDLGWMDEDGYVYVAGRSKDLIIRGGFNVYPPEVEAVLDGHAAVAKSVVVGRPDDHYGQEVVAFVVLADPSTPFDAEELIEYASSLLAPYKYPRRVIVRDELPLGPSGKIDKRALEAELRDDPRST